MILNFKKVSMAGTSLAVVLSLVVGCSVLTNRMTFSGNSLSAASVGTATKKVGNLSLASFSTIKKYVKSTLFENVEGTSKKTTVSVNYDLNGDGKKEKIKLSFSSSGDKGKANLSVHLSKFNLPVLSLAGVYLVDLDKSDKFTEIAIVENYVDTDVKTYFFRYDNRVKFLGSIYGSFVDRPCYGYSLKAYNIGILADGNGRLLPRFGVIRYVSPQIMLNAYELKNEKIQSVKLDFSKVLNKTYTVTYNIKPYFEQMSSVPKKFMPKCSDSDIITIKKGNKITFKSISITIDKCFYSLVQLQNKKEGALYFFVHP